MDRRRLSGYLQAGMSLEQIAQVEARDPSTVGYWVAKHGLCANGKTKHAARGPLSRRALEEMTEQEMTLAEIAKVVDRSTTTVRYWLGKYGLKTGNRVGPRPAVRREIAEAAVRAGARTVQGRCAEHGPGLFVIEASGRVRCRRCRMERVAKRRRAVRRILVEEAGGRCVCCGYDRFVGALHFHHREPRRKRFGISEKGATIGIEKLRAEASKCVLLCANCHVEVEHGIRELPLK